jgi:hypothetical protein
MIDPGHPRLSIVRQCELVSIGRSSFYREPTPDSAENLLLMRLIDEQFLETPWYGSRQMARHLRRNGWCVGRHRVRRLMTRMGLAPIYQRPKTSEPHPRHKIYPYLLRHLTIDRPNQVWCADITYIQMRRGFLYLVVVMDWARGDCSIRPARYLQHRSGLAVHQLRLHYHDEGRRHPHFDGWPWPLDGQRLHRTAVAIAEIRVRVPECIRDRQRSTGWNRPLDQLLQHRSSAFGSRRQDARRGLCYAGKRGEIGGVIKPRIYLSQAAILSRIPGPPHLLELIRSATKSLGVGR